MPLMVEVLLLSADEAGAIKARLIRKPMKRLFGPILGSEELISGKLRYALWIENVDFEEAQAYSNNALTRLNAVAEMRSK